MEDTVRSLAPPPPTHPRDPLLPHVPRQAGGEGLGGPRVGWGGGGGPEREPASRLHRAQAQAPKHNSGTSSHLDPGPMSLQRSTPGLPYISSPIPGTMPLGAQHLSLRSHLTTLVVDTLDRLGGALWPERNQNFKARQKP